jgi:tetratricopeptide (TPR) repeat protein
MKAATKKGAAAARRGEERAKTRRSAPRLRGISLSRGQWIAAIAVVAAIAIGAGGYFGWRAFSNREIDYNGRLKTSEALKPYQIGLAAASAGRKQEAENAFQRAIDADPTNALPYNALATFYVGQGDLQRALVACENGVNAAPGSPDLYYTLGVTRYQTGRFDDAAQALQKALAIRPEYPEAALWLGNTYLLQSKLAGVEGGDPAKLADAIAQFRRAAELDPDVADYHSALAEGLYQRRDLAEARAEMQRAIELDPKNTKYPRSLGKICDQLDDLDAAAAAFTNATKLDPTDAESFYGLGLVYFKKQQDADAVAAFRDALKVNPYAADAHEKLGQTLVRMGQQDEGQHELQAAEDSRVRERKINDMRRASAADPGDAALANNLGIELARQGDYDDAMQAFQRALTADPRFVDAQYQIGGLYATRNKVVEAIQAFTTVDKMKPGYRWTNYYLGKLNEKINRKAEAAKRLKMFEAQKARGEVGES